MPGWYKQMRTVYDPEGIAPTLCAAMGGGGNKLKNNSETKEQEKR